MEETDIGIHIRGFRNMLEEQRRLVTSAARQDNWQRWGPYLSERQWSTVREDYSSDQDAWSHFPHV